jgi:hypothetical protein
LSSRSNHDSKSIAQGSSWCSESSQKLEGLVELENMFEEDEGREGNWLNISIVVANISEHVDGIIEISESSSVEGFSFTSNHVGCVGSSSQIGGENERLSDNERDKMSNSFLENSSLRGVGHDNVEGSLKSGFTGNW